MSPRTSGPETASSLAMPSQGYPLQPRAVLDPRFHSQTQTQTQTQPQPQPQPQPGVVHPVGTDQREKEAGRNVSGVHDGVVVESVVTPQAGVGVSVSAATVTVTATATATTSGVTANGRVPVPVQSGASRGSAIGIGGGSGSGGGSGQQSLPSLKASGLLEWPLPSGSVEASGGVVPPAPVSAPTSTSTGWTAGGGSGVHSLAVHARTGGGRSPPLQTHAQTPSQVQVQAPSQVQVQTQPPLPPSEGRTSPRGGLAGPSSGMPVGLQWLAHESTVVRPS